MIYLDYNATTPCDPRVVEAMEPFLRERFENPSSLYQGSRENKKAIEKARQQVARLLDCLPEEVFFTSGGTEADNWAIKSTAWMLREKGRQIITSRIEHHAVLNTCAFLEKQGFQVTYLPVDHEGLVDLQALKNAVTSQTILVSIMHANNEIGTIQPIEEIAAFLKEKGIIFHTDAVQTTGKLSFSVKKLGVDMLSLSAHKFYGPKGVGALYIRKGLRLFPLIHGGEQEHGRRAGTENVAGIVGLGKAAELALAEREEEEIRVRRWRDLLEEKVRQTIPEVVFNGHREKRLDNTANFCVKYVEGESMLLSLDL
ncbi:MAG: cysteine desulfurase, partial [Candidatus Omnitrophica bacterium]|nr:cysteine desulfurase [Candidatus Omnitrophota bacterium]